jgi:hypothetical protein
MRPLRLSQRRGSLTEVEQSDVRTLAIVLSTVLLRSCAVGPDCRPLKSRHRIHFVWLVVRVSSSRRPSRSGRCDQPCGSPTRDTKASLPIIWMCSSLTGICSRRNCPSREHIAYISCPSSSSTRHWAADGPRRRLWRCPDSAISPEDERMNKVFGFDNARFERELTSRMPSAWTSMSEAAA